GRLFLPARCRSGRSVPAGASELQSCCARTVSERFDPPVIQIAATVENNRIDAFGLGALRDRLADCPSAIGLVARERAAHAGLVGARRRQRGAARIVDDLAVDVLQAAEDAHAWSLWGAAQCDADAEMTALARRASVSWFEHGYFFLAPALPALR